MASLFQETEDGIVYSEPRGLGVRLLAGLFGLMALGIFGFAISRSLRGPTWGDTAGLLVIALLPLAIGGVFLLAAFHRRQHASLSASARRITGVLLVRRWFGARVDRPFADVRTVGIERTELENGTVYGLRLVMRDGVTYALGIWDRREDAEVWRSRIAGLIAAA